MAAGGCTSRRADRASGAIPGPDFFVRTVPWFHGERLRDTSHRTMQSIERRNSGDQMAAIMSLDEPRPRGTNDAYGIRASNFWHCRLAGNFPILLSGRALGNKKTARRRSLGCWHNCASFRLPSKPVNSARDVLCRVAERHQRLSTRHHDRVENTIDPQTQSIHSQGQSQFSRRVS
jgi:hypothetical protein